MKELIKFEIGEILLAYWTLYNIVIIRSEYFVNHFATPWKMFKHVKIYVSDYIWPPINLTSHVDEHY